MKIAIGNGAGEIIEAYAKVHGMTNEEVARFFINEGIRNIIQTEAIQKAYATKTFIKATGL